MNTDHDVSTKNLGSVVNYEPNIRGGSIVNPKRNWTTSKLSETVGRFSFGESDDLIQPKGFYKNVMSETKRENLVKNTAAHMKEIRKKIPNQRYRKFTTNKSKLKLTMKCSLSKTNQTKTRR